MGKHYSKTSKTGMKHPYQIQGFWEKNQIWETDSYTEKGKEYLRKFLEKTKSKKIKDDTTLNRNHL